MKISQMIESKFLAKADFEEDQVCTIKSIGQANVGKDEAPEQRWVVYFNGYKKPMVANITALRVLAAAFGDESDGWVGRKVTVYVDPNVTFGGKVVGGLRLRPIKNSPPKDAVSQPQSVEPLDDEIPF